MKDLATLSTWVLAGILSVRARVKAVPKEKREDEAVFAMNDLLRVSYGGMPGKAPGDVGDEPLKLEALLRLYEDTLKI